MKTLKKIIATCHKCPLGFTRLTPVFGEGNPNAKLMFVGEAPGFQEDHQGIPFCGRSGKLLTKIINESGLLRTDVFISNIVKCHPMKDPSNPQKHSNDRPPTSKELSTCKQYLDMQIDLIKPKVIVTLGASSSKTLLATKESIGNLRGNLYTYKAIKLIPTYHPAALLRNMNLKKFVDEDMKKIIANMS
jgi:DNA polymerase